MSRSGTKRRFDDLDKDEVENPTSARYPPQTNRTWNFTVDEIPSDKDLYYKQLYAIPPDFQTLARRDPAFAAVLQGRDLDFNDPAAVKQLTKTLLRHDFGLQIELPDDRLCPPVANRHNYILWLKDLLDTTTYDAPGGKRVGLDIGTGASCIYPLLGCTQRPWAFIATDIDEKSLEYAIRNISLNNLQHRIHLLARSPTDPLLPLTSLAPQTPAIHFTMTNPPFYDTKTPLPQQSLTKSMPPNSVCTGSPSEMATPGGEVSFVQRILAESLIAGERIQWYTAMLGFLSSVSSLVASLKEAGIDNYAVTEFVQGSKTRRWAVGWSFSSMRPALRVARGTEALPRGLRPPITEVTVVEMALLENRVGPFAMYMSVQVGALDTIRWGWDVDRLEGVGRTADAVWARAWRRRKKREGTNTDQKHNANIGNSSGVDALVAIGRKSDHKTAFGFKMSVRVSKNSTSVELCWLEGLSETIFESFTGFLKQQAQNFDTSTPIQS